MTRLRRLRRIGLAIVVGVLVMRPTAGSALAGLTATAAD
jgi:deoxyinosine 3'endonuclease (endonuclease V)